MIKGDIVLISFPFTDLTGKKSRPAVVLINSPEDVTVCFITTQTKWKSSFDIVIEPSQNNGLKKTSIIRLNKFATIDKDLVLGRLGQITVAEIQLLNKNLLRILKLD
jgi:mRNA interferase MazF